MELITSHSNSKRTKFEDTCAKPLCGIISSRRKKIPIAALCSAIAFVCPFLMLEKKRVKAKVVSNRRTKIPWNALLGFRISYLLFFRWRWDVSLIVRKLRGLLKLSTSLGDNFKTKFNWVSFNHTTSSSFWLFIFLFRRITLIIISGTKTDHRFHSRQSDRSSRQVENAPQMGMAFECLLFICFLVDCCD